MSILIDFILLAILIITVILSARRGFIATAAQVVGFILAFVLAAKLCVPLANAAYNKVIEPKIVNALCESIPDGTSVSIDEIWEQLPEFLTENGETFGITRDTISDKLDIGNTFTKETVSDISQKAIKPIVSDLLESILSLLLLTLFMIPLGFLARFLNKLFSFSIIGKLNRFLGGVIGIPQGIIIAYVFCNILFLFLFVFPDGLWIFNKQNIDNSYFYSLLMGFSPFK